MHTSHKLGRTIIALAVTTSLVTTQTATAQETTDQPNAPTTEFTNTASITDQKGVTITITCNDAKINYTDQGDNYNFDTNITVEPQTNSNCNINQTTTGIFTGSIEYKPAENTTNTVEINNLNIESNTGKAPLAFTPTTGAKTTAQIIGSNTLTAKTNSAAISYQNTDFKQDGELTITDGGKGQLQLNVTKGAGIGAGETDSTQVARSANLTVKGININVKATGYEANPVAIGAGKNSGITELKNYQIENNLILFGSESNTPNLAIGITDGDGSSSTAKATDFTIRGNNIATTANTIIGTGQTHNQGLNATENFLIENNILASSSNQGPIIGIQQAEYGAIATAENYTIAHNLINTPYAYKVLGSDSGLKQPNNITWTSNNLQTNSTNLEALINATDLTIDGTATDNINQTHHLLNVETTNGAAFYTTVDGNKIQLSSPTDPEVKTFGAIVPGDVTELEADTEAEPMPSSFGSGNAVDTDRPTNPPAAPREKVRNENEPYEPKTPAEAINMFSSELNKNGVSTGKIIGGVVATTVTVSLIGLILNTIFTFLTGLSSQAANKATQSMMEGLQNIKFPPLAPPAAPAPAPAPAENPAPPAA